MTPPLSPRRRLLFAVLAGLLVAGVAGTAVALTRSGTPAARRSARSVPVVLVPGYGGSPASLRTLAHRLEQAGRRTVIVSLPDHGEGDIGASAAVLATAVQATHAPRVDLVGYSAGGIVVRDWLELDGGAAHARRVVLLGAPNHGADLAAIALLVLPGDCTGACAELAPGSALLDRLNALGLPPGLDTTSLWTDRDLVVVPPDSAVLAGSRDVRLQAVCADDGVGHTGLPDDPLVLGLVVRALGGGLAGVPGPAACTSLRALGSA